MAWYDVVNAVPEAVGEFWNRINGTVQQQNFNSAEAQKSRDFQKEMAQNQYQWAVNDLKAAGLNPAMLYASGGNGNSAPGTAMATSSQGRAMDLIGNISGIMNSITSARLADGKLKQNEFSRNSASSMYNQVAKIARILGREFDR